MKTLAIIINTVRESFSRYSFLVFFGASTMILLAAAAVMSLDAVQGGMSAAKIMAGMEQLQGQAAADWLGKIYRIVLVILYSAGIFLALLATADLMPNLLKKGVVDLLLTKPVSRPGIYLARFAGGAAIAGINIVYLVGGLWLILSLKTGQWIPGFLLGGLFTWLMFCVILSFTMFIGLLFRSIPIILIFAYSVIFGSQAAYGMHAYPEWDKVITDPARRALYKFFSEAVYYSLPRFHEMGKIIFGLGEGPWQGGLGLLAWSLAFGAVFLALGILVFHRRDF